MARWSELAESEPTFAAAVRAQFEMRLHKTIATVRADGSPRISGIETVFIDGDLWFRSIPNARKAVDLQRDPRFALHSGSVDPPDWAGDAKLSGRAEEVKDHRLRAVFDPDRREEWPTYPRLFRADIEEVVLMSLNVRRDHLLIDLWRPGQPLKRVER